MPDVVEMVARARIRTADEDWAAAAELWAAVTAANPVNGDYWARLGEARFGAHDYRGAREAYEKVLRLGVRATFLAEDAPPLMPGEVAYRIDATSMSRDGGWRYDLTRWRKSAGLLSTRPWPRWIRSCPGITTTGSR